jgi:hypothetical protein
MHLSGCHHQGGACGAQTEHVISPSDYPRVHLGPLRMLSLACTKVPHHYMNAHMPYAAAGSQWLTA